MKAQYKKSKIILVLFILFCFNILQAQVAEEWFAGYSGPGNGIDQANSMVLDGSNNVYITGSSIGSGTGSDYATIKYNSSGVQQWVQRYNGPGNSLDEAYDIAIDASGNVYVTGRSRATSGENTADYATIKYNSSGEQQWVARYNGTVSGPDEAYALVLDDLNNVYVTGQSGYTQLNANIATIKYNSSGVQQWLAIYNGPGNDWDKGTSLAVDESRNVYVTGGHNVSVGTAYHDYVTIKYDSLGNQQWLNTYNGPGNNWDEAVSIGLDGFGNVYITGYSTGTVYDFATIRYNSSGVEEWVQRYSSSGNSVDVPTSMVVDGIGTLYITGAIAFNYGTIKYTPFGFREWVATYDASGNFDAANSIAIDDDGNVYVTGQSSSGSPESTKDYATVKYDANGIEQWVQRHNGTGNDWDEANSIAVDELNNVYITGFSSVSGSSDYGTIKYSQTVLGIQTVSGGIPNEFKLLQNYPNPFNPGTVVNYQLAVGSFVSLKIYDVLGNHVVTLVYEKQNAGTYVVEWDAGNFSSGIYFYTLVADGFVETKMMTLLK